MKRVRTGVIAVVGAVTLALGVGAFVNHNSEENRAQRMCAAEVLLQLQSPPTGQVQVTETHHLDEAGLFGFKGYVDMQNGSGATTRNRWICTANPAFDITFAFLIP